MKVDKVNYQYGYYKNSFKSSDRIFFDKKVQKSFCLGKVSNYTYIFRKDIDDWFALAKYIITNFSKRKKINVYSLGCSDGSEAFSLAIALKKFMGKKRVFPIIAIDKDENIIRYAQSDRINLTGEDMARMNIILGDNQQYFTDIQDRIFIADAQNCTMNDWDSSIPRYYSLKKDKNLQNMVNFRIDNLLNVVNSIKDDGNSFVACRNVIPYLTDNDQKKLMNGLGKNLKPNSLVCIGNYDEHVDAERRLCAHGFEPTIFDNVFKKI